MTAPLPRRLLAEFLGAAFLAALVIGSGIAAERLSPDDTGLQLLYNSAATAAGLFTIILMFGPVSGGHFNPVVSLVDAELAHRLDDLRVRAAVRHGLAARGDRTVPSARGALEQRLAHHAAAAVGLADEQHRRHQAGFRARMIAEPACSWTRCVSRISTSSSPAAASAARNSASVSAPPMQPV